MRARPSKPQKTKPQPRLGIFWLVRDSLIFDSAPLSESEPYDTHLTHPRSHLDVWERWRAVGKVPPESEYDEFARGRVMYDPDADSFTLLADKCILSRKDLIEEIKRELHLPKKIVLGNDDHYRCFQCLYGKDDDKG